MRFSPKIKDEVKKRADFQCCRCHTLGPQVHHIIPVNKGGSDDISNAAPLCPTCHDQFGANPVKRKEITQMRDAWNEKVEKMYFGQVSFDQEAHRKLDEILNKIDKEPEKGVEELKDELIPYFKNMINNLTPDNAQHIASGLVNISTELSYIASGAAAIGGQAQYGYTPNILPMNKSVMTDDGKSV